MTSVTTLIVVVVLLLLGGPVLHGFSIALVVGILIGTYSSIYIASSVALDLGLDAESLFPTRKKLALDDLP
jgi:preprotein translocase subunit SecF